MMTFWERAYKTSGSSEAYRMVLVQQVVEGVCAVLEDCAFHSGRDTWHIPEGIANAFISMR
eukprot:1148576-Pelagomonas_calceolata.AAC.2